MASKPRFPFERTALSLSLLTVLAIVLSVGLVVDDLIGQEEVVIKPLGAMLQGLKGMAGATITGDGKIALIVDVPSLMRKYARKF